MLTGIWIIASVTGRFVWHHVCGRRMRLPHVFALILARRLVHDHGNLPAKAVCHSEEPTEERANATGGDEVLIRNEEKDVMLCHASMLVPTTLRGENNFFGSR